jgi:hypothetical protein
MKLRRFGLVAVLAAAWLAKAQDAKGIYPSMAPLDQTVLNNHHNLINSPEGAGRRLSYWSEHCVQRAHSSLRESKYSDSTRNASLVRFGANASTM